MDRLLQRGFEKVFSVKRRRTQDVNIYVHGAYSHWHLIDSSSYDATRRAVVRVLVVLLVRVDVAHRRRGHFKHGWAHLRALVDKQAYWKRLRVQSIRNPHLLAFLCEQPGARIRSVPPPASAPPASASPARTCPVFPAVEFDIASPEVATAVASNQRSCQTGDSVAAPAAPTAPLETATAVGAKE